MLQSTTKGADVGETLTHVGQNFVLLSWVEYYTDNIAYPHPYNEMALSSTQCDELNSSHNCVLSATMYVNALKVLSALLCT